MFVKARKRYYEHFPGIVQGHNAELPSAEFDDELPVGDQE